MRPRADGILQIYVNRSLYRQRTSSTRRLFVVVKSTAAFPLMEETLKKARKLRHTKFHLRPFLFAFPLQRRERKRRRTTIKASLHLPRPLPHQGKNELAGRSRQPSQEEGIALSKFQSRRLVLLPHPSFSNPFAAVRWNIDPRTREVVQVIHNIILFLIYKFYFLYKIRCVSAGTVDGFCVFNCEPFTKAHEQCTPPSPLA
jgi:hypothetical protein